MSGAFFVQPCPICGRQLEVRVRFLGKQVACRHCRGQFEARDPDQPEFDSAAVGLSDLQRADQLLSQLNPARLHPK
ncbi:MAG: hypothetical protein AAGF97_18155 [Planctomycetota bacterium]